MADAGVVLGASATEQLRTFGGKLFRLEDHLWRLFRSLEIMEIDPGYTSQELATKAQELVAANHRLLDSGDDLGLGIFVTPGPYASLTGTVENFPSVYIYSYPLPFGLWCDKYHSGDAIVVSNVMQIPPRVWPPELKCRSRMHYFLADQQARGQDPTARAILLDERGYVCEASTANIVMFMAAEGLVSPPRTQILLGISLMTLMELATALNIPIVERDIDPEELSSANELLLTSTSVCLLPVARVNGRPLGTGCVGPTYKRLLTAWCQLVGLNIAEQACRFSMRA